jgi:hypothetical protein
MKLSALVTGAAVRGAVLGTIRGRTDLQEPIVKLVLGVLFGDSIPLLQPAEEFVFAAGDNFQIVVSEISPPLPNLAFNFRPLAFNLIPIHGLPSRENEIENRVPLALSAELDSVASSYVRDQADQEQNEEDEEEDLGDARGGKCNCSETQQARNDRNDEKNQRIVKHGASFSFRGAYLSGDSRRMRSLHVRSQTHSTPSGKSTKRARAGMG